MKRFFSVFITVFLLCVSAAYAAAPHTVTVQPENSKLTIAWKNPAGVSISEIDILNQNGVSVAGDAVLSKTAGAVNIVPIEGLTNDKEYTFTIRITAAGKTEDTKVTATPVNKDKLFYTGDGYNLSKWEWKGGGNSIVRTIDTEEKHEGNSSLKIVSNYANNSYLQTNANQIKLDKSKNYRLTFWAKLLNSGNNKVQYMNDWKDPRYTISGSEWKQYTWDISGTDSLIFRIIVETTCDALWIDDIRLYEMNGDKPAEENLFPQGNFEFDAYDFQLNGTEISWVEPENPDFKGLDIYQRTLDGTRILLNTSMITKGITSFTIPDSALIDESYDLIFVSDINGIKTPGSVYKVYGNVDYFDTVLSNNGETITSLVPGIVTVAKEVQNNNMGDNFNVSLILALYKDNELIEMNFSEKIIPQNMQKNDLSASVIVPDDGGTYELQVFLWNDIEEMEILKDFESFK